MKEKFELFFEAQGEMVRYPVWKFTIPPATSSQVALAPKKAVNLCPGLYIEHGDCDQCLMGLGAYQYVVNRRDKEFAMQSIVGRIPRGGIRSQ